jgi:hypothetical protein
MITSFLLNFFNNYNLVLGFNITFNPPSSFALITSFVIPLLSITPLIQFYGINFIFAEPISWPHFLQRTLLTWDRFDVVQWYHTAITEGKYFE